MHCMCLGRRLWVTTGCTKLLISMHGPANGVRPCCCGWVLGPALDDKAVNYADSIWFEQTTVTGLGSAGGFSAPAGGR